MSQQIITLRLDAAWRRVLLFVPAAVVAVAAGYAVRWCAANEIAQWVRDRGAVAAAGRWAPFDPQPQFSLGRMSELSFEPEALAETVSRYERAAALSPNDYRLWMELGRARGQADDAAGAEAAYRRAVALAPTYPGPRWFLGNLLLRRGRDEEAFVELRRAGDIEPDTYRPQVFNLAWSAYGGDVRRVLDVVGDSPAARAGFVDYLIGRNNVNDAVALWEALGPEGQRDKRDVGEKLLNTLVGARRYRAALLIQRDLLASSAGARLKPDDLQVGRVTNGGFEAGVGAPGENIFDWQVVPIAGARMNLDARESRSGSRSLRLLFEATETINFANVTQLVAIEPQARYRLDFYVRTQDLKSANTLRLVVADPAAPAAALASSQPLALGTSEGWQPVTLEFQTGPQAEAVVLRVERVACDSDLCPLFGKVWYDDFNLQRAGGPAAPARPRD